MTLTLADQYFLKAMDEYPYCLEETIENLNYALSYEGEHAGANCLMGKVYLEQFQNFELAEEYFIKAMAADPFDLRTCENYMRLMIRTKRYQEAIKLLQFTKDLTGADLVLLLKMEAEICELKHEFDRAISLLKEAIGESLDSEDIYSLRQQIARVKMKSELQAEIKYSLY
ncbi:MAG: hypothetical protein AAGG59_02640 [Bacteroidota bacterium]